MVTADEIAVTSDLSAIFCRTYGLHDLADYYASLAEEARSNWVHRSGQRPPLPVSYKLLSMAYNAWLEENKPLVFNKLVPYEHKSFKERK